MTGSRWKPIGKLTNPFWEFQTLLDQGQPDLGDPSVPLFSLLPRMAHLPQIEGARLRLTLSHRASHGKVLATLNPERLAWYRVPTEENGWQRGLLAAQAHLMLPSGKGRVEGNLLWLLSFALHQKAPLLLWQSAVHNLSRLPVTLRRYAPLALGPDSHNLPRKGLLDLFPARFHIFRLLSRPISPSAYYNLTERFGSLRLSESARPFQAASLTMETLAKPLHAWWQAAPKPPTPPYWPSAPLTLQTLHIPAESRALLLITQNAHQAKWWVQDNPFAPGLRLVFYPEVTLAPGEAWQGPPVLLAWYDPEIQARPTLPDAVRQGMLT